MNRKILSKKDIIKDDKEYFIKYEKGDQVDGVVVVAISARKAVEMVEKEFGVFRLVDMQCLTVIIINQKPS